MVDTKCVYGLVTSELDLAYNFYSLILNKVDNFCNINS